MVDMKKTNLKYIILLVLLVLFCHIGFFLHQFIVICKIKDTRLKLLHQSQGVKLFLTYGNCIHPKKYDTEINFDAIVFLSPLEDPKIREVEDINQINYYYLVRDLFDVFVENAIQEMWNTGDPISATDIEVFLKTDLYKRDEGDIYLKEIPRDIELYRRSKIKTFLFIPILVDEQLMHPNEKFLIKYRENLKEKITMGLKRAFVHLPVEQNLYSVALPFPELGVSTKPPFSKFLLNYYQSFDAILSAIRLAEFPKSLERIYIVIRDDLPSDEFKGALMSFTVAYHKFKLNTNYLPFIILFTVAFCLGFIFSLQKKGRLYLTVNVFLTICILLIFIIPALWVIFKFTGEWLTHFSVKNRIALEMVFIVIFYYFGQSWLLLEDFHSKLKGER